jgi:carotene epsilon-monooxygenase
MRAAQPLPCASVSTSLLLTPPPLPPPAPHPTRYIPFSGGPRKCVGDQFALMEAVTALAVLLRRFEFQMVPGQQINMTTGATIHTTDGLYMTIKERAGAPAAGGAPAAAVAAA